MFKINISQKAQQYLQEIIKKKDQDNILRITIILPGTKYAECKISYDNIQNIRHTDFEIKYINFSIYVDKIFIPYLKDSKIDLFENHLNKQLMLMAPYANNQHVKNYIKYQDNDYISPTSLLFKKLERYISYNINPMLSNHGGKIILKNITKSGYILIEFLGGCNGCAMSATTVKASIEKNILNCFPSLKGVQDITQHHRGKHSFF